MMRNRRQQVLLSSIVMFALIALFQNCGKAFESNPSSASDKSKESESGSNTITIAPSSTATSSNNSSTSPTVPNVPEVPPPTPYKLIKQWNSSGATNSTPGARAWHSAVWTGTRMIVWGGYSGDPKALAVTNEGYSYDPTTGDWAPISKLNAPSARGAHIAIWTGSKMIVWGGGTYTSVMNDGGVYDPTSDSWSPLVQSGSIPSARMSSSAAYIGGKFIVWGGSNSATSPVSLNDGAIYDLATKTWNSISAQGAPSARAAASSVWTGSKFIVVGGAYSNGSGGASMKYLNDGAAYDPTNNSWSKISSQGAPSARSMGVAVWTGSKMIYWSGLHYSSDFVVTEFNDGGIYDPDSDSWESMNSHGKVSPRHAASAVWTGDSMIAWGGYYIDNAGSFGTFKNGGIFN